MDTTPHVRNPTPDAVKPPMYAGRSLGCEIFSDISAPMYDSTPPNPHAAAEFNETVMVCSGMKNCEGVVCTSLTTLTP